MSPSSSQSVERQRSLDALPSSLRSHVLRALDSPDVTVDTSTAEFIRIEGVEFPRLNSNGASWRSLRAKVIDNILSPFEDGTRRDQSEVQVAKSLHAVVAVLDLAGIKRGDILTLISNGRSMDLLPEVAREELQGIVRRLQRIDSDLVEHRDPLEPRDRLSVSRLRDLLSIEIEGKSPSRYQREEFERLRPELVTRLQVGPVVFDNPLEAIELYEGLPAEVKPQKNSVDSTTDSDNLAPHSSVAANSRLPRKSSDPRKTPGCKQDWPIERYGMIFENRAAIRLMADRVIGLDLPSTPTPEPEQIRALAEMIFEIMELRHGKDFVSRFRRMGRRIGESDAEDLKESGLMEPILRLWKALPNQPSTAASHRTESSLEDQALASRGKGLAPETPRLSSERIYDRMMQARAAEWVSIKFLDGGSISGAVIFNEFTGNARIVNVEEEISFDFHVDDVADVRI